MTQSPSWLSLHLFYHDDLTTPIIYWVSPLIAELRARHWLDKYFFLRYWQGGPHIRLRLLPAPIAHPEEIKTLLEESALHFFSTHPSTSIIDAQYYNETAAHLSQVEYHTDQHVPLYANNSYHYVPYEPEYHHYGGPEAMAHIETFFMQSSDLAIDLLSQGMTRDQATSHCLSAMLLVAACETTNPLQLSRLFENYFQGWERMPRNLSERLIDQFMRQHEQQQVQIRTLVAARLAMVRHNVPISSGHPSSSARWQTAAYHCFVQLTDLNEVTPLRIQHPLPGLSIPTNILLRCTHMYNNRLGVLLLEEAYLLFLLKQTLQEIAIETTGNLIPGEESSHA